MNRQRIEKFGGGDITTPRGTHTGIWAGLEPIISAHGEELLTAPFGVLPVPVAARSKASVCGRSPTEIVGSNPTGGMDVCCECCVFSGRGLCDELITRPEESYLLWRVAV